MEERLQGPNLLWLILRDRISFAGFLLVCPAGAAFFLLPLFFRNITFAGSFLFALLPFCIGSAFLVPRILIINKLYKKGRCVRGRVEAKEDTVGGHSGTKLMIAYSFEGTAYRCEIRTHWILENVNQGEVVTVLLDPERPSRAVLPVLYS